MRIGAKLSTGLDGDEVRGWAWILGLGRPNSGLWQAHPVFCRQFLTIPYIPPSWCCRRGSWWFCVSAKPARLEESKNGLFTHQRVSLWSVHDRKPHETPFSLNVSAALTGTKGGNVEGGSKMEWHLFEGNPPTQGRVPVFCLPPATWAAPGGGKELGRRRVGAFRPRPLVRVHPPRSGVEAGRLRENAVE